MRNWLLALTLALLGGAPSIIPAQTGLKSEAEQKSTLLVPPKRWALVIGAGNYDSLGQLRYAPADARSFAKALTEDFKFQPESVLTLTDENEDTRPTVANIRASLDTVLKDPRLNKGDLFVFYFSGHGVGTPKGDYLCPTDATIENVSEVGLPVKEVIERFVKAGLRNVLVLTDACRGGEKNTFGQELNRLSDQANIGVMLGCAPGSRSYQWNRVGHGYFTHFLLQALKNPDLRQKGTGALWASEVGQWMSQRVCEATESSQPTTQTPAIECDDRRDIMLGAFLPSETENSIVDGVKQTTEKLTPERQAATLSDYGSRLFMADRFYEAAEMLRIVDGLGKAEEADQLLLATSLAITGRTSEASRWFDRLKKSGHKVYANAATLLDDRTADFKSKTVAAQELVRALDSISASLGYLGLIGAPGTNPYRAEVIREILAKPNLKVRTRLFLEGDLEFELGRLDTAEAKLRASLSTFGLVPDETTVRLKLAALLLAKNDFAGHAKLCGESAELGERSAHWRLSQSATLRFYLNKKEEAFAGVKKALEQDLSAKELIDCVGIAGSQAVELAERLLEQCDRHPRAWEAHVVRFLVGALVNERIVAVLPPDNPAFRYADDEHVVARGFEFALNGMWTDWLEEGAIPNEVYRDMMVLRSGRLIKLARSAQDDPDIWWFTVVNGIRAFRTPQILILFNQKYGKALADGSLTPTQRAQYALVAFNASDFELFDKITKGALVGGDEINVGWLKALTLLIRGQEVKLPSAVAALKDPGSDYEPMATALKLYAKTASMKPDDAKNLLLEAAVDDPSAKAIIGLAFLRMGDLESARPLLEDSISMMNWAFQGLHAHALMKLALAERKAGNDEPADLITFWLQMSQPGQPSLKLLQYGNAPGLAGLQGDHKFTGRQVDDNTEVKPVSAGWTIDAKGQLKGQVAGFALAGNTDARGNFTGEATVLGKKWLATAKLAPAETYKRMEQFREESQVLVLLSPEGERLIYALKPRS